MRLWRRAVAALPTERESGIYAGQILVGRGDVIQVVT